MIEECTICIIVMHCNPVIVWIQYYDITIMINCNITWLAKVIARNALTKL